MFLLFGLIFLSACSLKETPDENLNTYVNSPKSADLEAGQEFENPVIVLDDGNYIVDAENSSLVWAASKVLSGHTGKVSIKSGEITISGGIISGLANVIIDMKTISDDENNEALVKHLNSADFFDTANFSEAQLNIISITSRESNQYDVEADLTIKGITNKISFPAQISTNGSSLNAQATFSINRTLWDIKYQSASFLSDLGDKAINDVIDFRVDLSAKTAAF